MCTIGVTSDKDRLIVFKQCDLEDKVIFNNPELRGEKNRIQYYAFTRQNSSGLWAGVNNYGVSFVAADAYMQGMPMSTYERHSGGASTNDIFTKYEEIVSKCETAIEAKDRMVSFYKEFDEPDILMICDRNDQFFIETNKKQPLVVSLFNGDSNQDDDFDLNNYFVSTNHFRFLYHGVTFPENHSTYLRLQRAEAILQQKPNEAGVNELLKDQYYGRSVFSICRENKICPNEEEKYFTQATAYFVIDKNNVLPIQAKYQINGNLRENSLVTIEPFMM